MLKKCSAPPASVKMCAKRTFLHLPVVRCAFFACFCILEFCNVALFAFRSFCSPDGAVWVMELLNRDSAAQWGGGDTDSNRQSGRQIDDTLHPDLPVLQKTFHSP